MLVLVACSGNKPRAVEDAASLPRDVNAGGTPPIAIDAPSVPQAMKTGDLQIRVEWRDVPVPMRASPGKTPCKTARAPVVSPTTTWGIPDVLVVVEGAAIPSPASRIVLADCALTPRIATATSLVLESAVDRPARVTFAKRGKIGALDKLDPASPTTIQLPIAGHAVALPLDPDGVYEVGVDGETAWIVASASAGVTEANGQLTVRDLAPGSYAVTAWLPPRAGGPARRATGTAAVTSGELAELILELK